MVRHIFQACPVWIYNRSNITKNDIVKHVTDDVQAFTQVFIWCKVQLNIDARYKEHFCITNISFKPRSHNYACGMPAWLVNYLVELLHDDSSPPTYRRKMWTRLKVFKFHLMPWIAKMTNNIFWKCSYSPIFKAITKTSSKRYCRTTPMTLNVSMLNHKSAWFALMRFLRL